MSKLLKNMETLTELTKLYNSRKDFQNACTLKDFCIHGLTEVIERMEFVLSTWSEESKKTYSEKYKMVVKKLQDRKAELEEVKNLK